MRPIWCITLSALLATVLAFGSSSARTWYVKVDGTGDAPTIQAAVDSVSPGDSIVVAAGTYTWNNQNTNSQYGMIHVVRGKTNFILRSESGPHMTILDARRQGRVMFIAGYNYMTVEGFTITGGDAPAFGYYWGGGIAAHLSHDTVRDCIMVDNFADQGGGLWCGGISAMTIENCEIRNNQALKGGGMLFVNSPEAPTITGCVIEDNVSTDDGGGVFFYNNAGVIENTLIATNVAADAGGIVFAQTQYPLSFTSCTLVSNSAAVGGGFHLVSSPQVSVDRCVVVGNGNGLYSLQSGSAMTVSCSDMFLNMGGDGFVPGVADLGGNFFLDPQFCGSPSGDYSLAATSPCAMGNHPDGASCGAIGMLGVTCGGVRVEVQTWGAVKSRYLDSR